MSRQKSIPRPLVIVIQHWLISRALCGCGWEGKGRLIFGRATLDAWAHAADHHHELGRPLVVSGDLR